MIEGAFLQLVRTDQSRNISWFDDNLRSMREILNLLNDHCKQYRSDATLLEFKNYKIRYQQALQAAKINSNDRIIGSSKYPVKSMWQIIDRFGGSLKGKEEEVSITPEEYNELFANIANNLIDGVPDTNTDPLRNLKNNNVMCNEVFIFNEVTFIEIRDIIEKIKIALMFLD